MFGEGNYDLQRVGIQFSCMLCSYELLWLLCKSEFLLDGDHVELCKIMPPPLSKETNHVLSRLNASFKVMLLCVQFKLALDLYHKFSSRWSQYFQKNVPLSIVTWVCATLQIAPFSATWWQIHKRIE